MTTTTTFHHFLQLPYDVRLMIWENTWPDARIVEITSGDSLTSWDDDLPRFLSLRPTCYLSTWMKNNITNRCLEEEEPFEECPNPVSLYVCHESRTYTLTRFTWMHHRRFSRGFYLDPQSDILWVSEDATYSRAQLNGLEDHYGHQLGRIKTVLVGEVEWDTRKHVPGFLNMLTGLFLIKVVLNPYQYRNGDFLRPDHYTTPEEYSQVARKLQLKDTEELRGVTWTIQYIDLTEFEDVEVISLVAYGPVLGTGEPASARALQLALEYTYIHTRDEVALNQERFGNGQEAPLQTALEEESAKAFQYNLTQQLAHSDVIPVPRCLPQLWATPHQTRTLGACTPSCRRLEFDAIGRLLSQDDGNFTVSNPIATMDLNAQALEGLQPSQVLARYSGGGPLRSASQYISLLHDIADDAFARSRSSILENDGIGEEYLYHLRSFRKHVDDWRTESGDDHGPFVLVHVDFQLFNLLANDQVSIVSILDWEWSRVVPRQFFKPPLWLHAVRQKEPQAYGNTMLAEEWNKAQEGQGFLIANALESWTHVDWLMHNQEDSEGLEERVREFMSKDPRRADLIASKVRDASPTSLFESPAIGGGMEEKALRGLVRAKTGRPIHLWRGFHCLLTKARAMVLSTML
ncbi:phosphotransferase enzyme family [Fusarium albosuccineum]|uniref:Phosphotransferase enzyme family n=1 Tax=Fusarium albosuccineum TaxID=1237068 RepID=A0A8H4LQT4_9HYPO|nr:phosphotransferase enzyme family [Fusarium albosuccineum]